MLGNDLSYELAKDVKNFDEIYLIKMKAIIKKHNIDGLIKW